MASPSVLVVGAGISGLSAAHALLDRGADVTVVDRGEEVGGRLAISRLGGRIVDMGASYFTSPDGSAFASLVNEWTRRGLARPWTDTFSVASPDGLGEAKTGPTRFAAPGGLQSLVADLVSHAIARGATVRSGVDVQHVGADGDGVQADGARYDAVVLALPDPQAARLLAPKLVDELIVGDAKWEAVLAIAAEWPERWWPADLHGAFVHDSPAVSFIADDGDRRGDGAPVLVIHTTDELARRNLEDPGDAIPIALAAAAALGGDPSAVGTPTATLVQRWTFAKPTSPREAPFGLTGRIGICGDAWGGKSSVSAAWESGAALGGALPLP